VYRQRIVCYLSGDKIEVLDLDQTDEWTDQVLLGSLVNRSEYKSNRYKVRLLNYNDGVLVLHLVGESAEDGGHILAVRLDKAALDASRIIARIPLPSVRGARKLFVRHTASILIYGTYAASARTGFEWILYAVHFHDKRQWGPTRLNGFTNAYVGRAVAFLEKLYSLPYTVVYHFLFVSFVEHGVRQWTSRSHGWLLNWSRHGKDRMYIAGAL
jgi:hypothetical protein